MSFYNDIRGVTLWGATRPDYGRGEFRTFLRDSAMTWLEEFRCDGLRFNSTVHMRTTEGYPALPGSTPLPDGWSFLAWMNDEIKARQPWKITIAEDLEDDPILVTPTEDGGAGFAAQWDAGFIRRVRPQLEAHDDAARDIDAVVAGILGEGRGAALSRVIYTESHDEVANGLVRVPEAIAPGAVTDNWWATKRAVLGSGLVLTSPGIPMLFQGQELLEDRWFDDTVSLDWEKTGTNRGILQLHRDLIALRRARDGMTRGLRGPTSGSSATTRRPRSWRCIAGRRADRTTTRSSSPTSPTGPSTTCRSGSRCPAAGTSASTPMRRPTPTCSAATRRSTWTPTGRRSTTASRADSSRSGRTAW